MPGLARYVTVYYWVQMKSSKYFRKGLRVEWHARIAWPARVDLPGAALGRMALARWRRTNHETAQARPFFACNQQSMMMRFACKATYKNAAHGPLIVTLPVD